MVGIVSCSLLSCSNSRNSLLKCGSRISNMTGSLSGTGQGRLAEDKLPSVFLGGLLAPTDTNTSYKYKDNNETII